MRLIGDFYNVVEALPPAQGMVYGFRIRLNAGHMIYRAHFPGHPVTPGVCLIQMVSELAEEALGIPLAIGCVKNVKFTDVVSPVTDCELCMAFTSLTESDDGTLKVQAQLLAADNPARVFSKFSMTLRKK